MKVFFKSCVVFWLLGFPSVHAEQEFTDANALMRHIDRLWRSNSSYAVMSMLVVTDRYERRMEMEAWSLDKDKSLIIIKAPKKDKDIATLKVENNIWNYLPKIDRISKIPASMMSGAWMGSHFTNDDLVKENTFEDDFTSVISFQGLRDQQSIIEITSTPKTDAAVVWGKVITEIDRHNLSPLRAVYYDENNQQVRQLIFDQPKIINGNTVPMRMSLIPSNKPGEQTIVTYHQLEFDVPLTQDIFTLQNLQKRR